MGNLGVNGTPSRVANSGLTRCGQDLSEAHKLWQEFQKSLSQQGRELHTQRGSSFVEEGGKRKNVRRKEEVKRRRMKRKEIKVTENEGKIENTRERTTR